MRGNENFCSHLSAQYEPYSPKGGERVMKNYELIYVLRPNLDDEAKTAVLDKVKAIVETSGEVEKVDVWGVRRLAYEIQKLNEGFYVLVSFKAGADLPKELDRNLKINDAVIRHMIVNLDEK